MYEIPLFLRDANIDELFANSFYRPIIYNLVLILYQVQVFLDTGQILFFYYPHEPHHQQVTYKSYRHNLMHMRVDDQRIILANPDILSEGHVPPLAVPKVALTTILTRTPTSR